MPLERAEREGVASWDLSLDARRRRDVRLTLILDPSLALVAWVHYAPPLNDSFRKSYRQFLKWNDEFPFVKFALSADERPVLTSEVPARGLDRDVLGFTIARLLAICDLLLDESAHWLWPGGKVPQSAGAGGAETRPGRIPRERSAGEGAGSAGTVLLELYAHELGELLAAASPDADGVLSAADPDGSRAEPAATLAATLDETGSTSTQRGP